MKLTVNFTLNDEKRSVDMDSTDILLDVLRDKLGMKSPKCGCGRGDCGTCSVFINDQVVKSCLVLGVEVEGQSVTTLEGLMKDDMTDLQKKFLERNSFQCGFCAPGMIIAATDLLGKNPKPSEEEIKEAISGNLCRCTGYTPVIEAITELVRSHPQ